LPAETSPLHARFERGLGLQSRHDSAGIVPGKEQGRLTGSRRMTGETEFQFESFDAGRLVINREFRPLLKARGLTTFAALFGLQGGEVVRTVGRRSTARIALSAGENTEVFFLKRHQPARFVDRVKPILHFSRPIVGARTEWEAILRYRAAGIPTMT